MPRRFLLAILLGCSAGGANAQPPMEAEAQDIIPLRPRISPNGSVVHTLPVAARRSTAVSEPPAAIPGRLAVSVAPYAGFSQPPVQGAPHIGAIVRLSRKGSDGVDDGRPYLFAAAGGQAVGLGWRADQIGAFAGDVQVGLGWRQGDVRSSLGLVYRQMKRAPLIPGRGARSDTLAALTVSIGPSP